MFVMNVGIFCDYPGCGTVHSVSRAAHDPGTVSEEVEPPPRWTVVQVVGADGPRFYCQKHMVRIDGKVVTPKRAVGFLETEAAAAKEAAAATAEAGEGTGGEGLGREERADG